MWPEKDERRKLEDGRGLKPRADEEILLRVLAYPDTEQTAPTVNSQQTNDGPKNKLGSVGRARAIWTRLFSLPPFLKI